MVATPRQLSSLRAAGIVFPAPQRLAISQGIIFSAVGAGLGVALQAATGFSLMRTGFAVPTLAATLLGIVGHLVLYYLVFRPRIPRQSVLLAERIRLGMGLPARVLQGGVTEEVQFRWGLMSTAAITLFLFPADAAAAIPLAIVLSALLFAFFHLVGGRQIGLTKDPMETGLIIVDNTWGGIVFGWLFWQHGLAAAMIAHAALHIAWFPIERWFYRTG